MILNREKLQHGLFDTPILKGTDKRMEIVAKNILTILEYEGLTNYHNMTEAYSWLCARYWLEIDGLPLSKQVTQTKSEPITRGDFTDWMRHKATASDDITRALRWLRSEGYVIMDKNVTEKAKLAGSEYARARGGK